MNMDRKYDFLFACILALLGGMFIGGNLISMSLGFILGLLLRIWIRQQLSIHPEQ